MAHKPKAPTNEAKTDVATKEESKGVVLTKSTAAPLKVKTVLLIIALTWLGSSAFEVMVTLLASTAYKWSPGGCQTRPDAHVPSLSRRNSPPL